MDQHYSFMSELSQSGNRKFSNSEQWLLPSTISFLNGLNDYSLDIFLRHWSTPGNGIITDEAVSSESCEKSKSTTSASTMDRKSTTRNRSAVTDVSNMMRVASSTAAASFLRAQQYFQAGDLRLAASYIVNGGFMSQLLQRSLDDMRQMLHVQFGGKESPELLEQLPSYKHSYHAVTTGPDAMRALLNSVVTQSRTVLTHEDAMRNNGRCVKKVDMISESWSSEKASRKHSNKSRKSTSLSDLQNLSEMVMVFKDDDETGKEVEMQVPRDVPLKQYLRQYAEDLSASVSRMQFAVTDEETGERKSIFASEMGRKTTEELRWTGERVVVFVKHIQNSETTAEESNTNIPSQGANRKNRRRAKRSNKAKNQKKKQHAKKVESEEQKFEKCRLLHSRQISEVFAEASIQLTAIRRALDATNLERTLPKVRDRQSSKKVGKNDASVMSFCDFSGSVGGKAGIPRYMVRIGEIAHLYKTSKPIALRRGGAESRRRSSIDLHGLTRKEAIDALDEKLPSWVEDANTGGCPWVTTVEIVVGGGNQVLSEAVRQWIRRNDRVARAPAAAFS